MKKKFLISLLLCVMLFSLASCGKKDTSKIQLGLIGPFTGKYSTYGNAVKNGVALAVDQINEANGVLIDSKVKKINLVVEDDKGDAIEAVNAYNRLYKKIDFLIGDVTSDNAEAVASKSVKHNTPVLTPTATASSVTKDRNNVFRTCLLDPVQGSVMAKFAKNTLDAKRVVVMYDQSNNYSLGVASAFISYAEEIGLNVVKVIDGLTETTEFATLVDLALAENPDCIFSPIYYEAAAVLIKEVRTDDKGKTLPILGSDGFDGVLTKLVNKKLVDNCYFSNHYFVGDEEEKVANFVNAYRAKFNEDPNAFAALAYDSVFLMKAAMEKANSVDSQMIIDALKELHIDCVTGNIKFDLNGDPIKDIVICEYDSQSPLGIKVKEKIKL